MVEDISGYKGQIIFIFWKVSYRAIMESCFILIKYGMEKRSINIIPLS